MTNHKSLLQTGTTNPGKRPGIGVTSDEAENAPRLRVTYGEDFKESEPPAKRRVKTHTASAQDNSTPVPWRWRSRGARIRGSHRPSGRFLSSIPRRVGPPRARQLSMRCSPDLGMIAATPTGLGCFNGSKGLGALGHLHPNTGRLLPVRGGEDRGCHGGTERAIGL